MLGVVRQYVHRLSHEDPDLSRARRRGRRSHRLQAGRHREVGEGVGTKDRGPALKSPSLGRREGTAASSSKHPRASLPGVRLPDQAFSTDQVIRLTHVLGAGASCIGLTTGSSAPTRWTGPAWRGRIRVWSFTNLLEVRVALWLREQVSRQLLGKIVPALRREASTRPWARSWGWLVVEDRSRKRVIVVQSPDGAWEEPLSGRVDPRDRSAPRAVPGGARGGGAARPQAAAAPGSDRAQAWPCRLEPVSAWHPCPRGCREAPQRGGLDNEAHSRGVPGTPTGRRQGRPGPLGSPGRVEPEVPRRPLRAGRRRTPAHSGGPRSVDGAGRHTSRTSRTTTSSPARWNKRAIVVTTNRDCAQLARRMRSANVIWLRVAGG